MSRAVRLDLILGGQEGEPALGSKFPLPMSTRGSVQQSGHGCVPSLPKQCKGVGSPKEQDCRQTQSVYGRKSLMLQQSRQGLKGGVKPPGRSRGAQVEGYCLQREGLGRKEEASLVKGRILFSKDEAKPLLRAEWRGEEGTRRGQSRAAREAQGRPCSFSPQGQGSPWACQGRQKGGFPEEPPGPQRGTREDCGEYARGETPGRSPLAQQGVS